MSDDTFTLTSVFKFLLKVLADLEEAAENKARAAQQRESDALMERARAMPEYATEAPVDYVPNTPIKGYSNGGE